MPQKWSSPWLVDLKLMMTSVLEVNFPARVSLLSCATSSFPVDGVNVKPGYSILVLAVGSPLARGQTALAEGTMKTNSVATESEDMIFIAHNHCELAEALIVDRKRPVRNVSSAPLNSDASKGLCTVKYAIYVASPTVWRVSPRPRKFST